MEKITIQYNVQYSHTSKQPTMYNTSLSLEQLLFNYLYSFTIYTNMYKMI